MPVALCWVGHRHCEWPFLSLSLTGTKSHSLPCPFLSLSCMLAPCPPGGAFPQVWGGPLPSAFPRMFFLPVQKSFSLLFSALSQGLPCLPPARGTMQAQQTPDVAWHTGRTAVQKRAYLWSEGHVTAVIAPFGVHPQNVRLQNVRFQNVRFQNVWNVRFTKRQVYKTSGLQNVRFTKRQVFKTSGCKKTSINILYLWLVEIRRFCCSHVCRLCFKL